jgi:hypothetical protein
MTLETSTTVLPMTSDTVGRMLNASGQSGSRKSDETCVSWYTRSVLAEMPRTVKPIRSASAVVPTRAVSIIRTVSILDRRWRSAESASNEDADPWERLLLLFSIFFLYFHFGCWWCWPREHCSRETKVGQGEKRENGYQEQDSQGESTAQTQNQR